jgi:hypothetical protein
MRRLRKAATLALLALGTLTWPLTAGARHLPAASTYETKNLHAIGHSFRPNTPNLPNQTFTANSDLAFWGTLAFQGHYDGFRILDIADPANPIQISRTECFGNQGDIVVWDNVLVRSWNSPATGTGSSQLSCDGQPVPVGFEGLHIFDISNPRDPVLVGEVELSARPLAARDRQNGTIGCGSHTATGVPDLVLNRLLIYNQTSGGPCPFISIIEVPLVNPGGARWLRNEPLADADACHDSAVILGDAMMLACASHDHTNVYSLSPLRGGSLEDPAFLYTITEPGVCNVPNDPLCNGNWHSAGFTWDGKVIILGWEPGGGAAPECEATDPPAKKSAFFYQAETGEKLGQWTLPRPQTAQENCTIHNYNVVPTHTGYFLVSGNYQSGLSVVDFTDPANAREIAYADPAPLSPPQLGGDWSTYFYNSFIYESDITRGLLVWEPEGRKTFRAQQREECNQLPGRQKDRCLREMRRDFKALTMAFDTAVRLDHLNPQTQEFTLDRDDDDDDDDGDDDDD